MNLTMAITATVVLLLLLIPAESKRGDLDSDRYFILRVFIVVAGLVFVWLLWGFTRVEPL